MLADVTCNDLTAARLDACEDILNEVVAVLIASDCPELADVSFPIRTVTHYQ